MFPGNRHAGRHHFAAVSKTGDVSQMFNVPSGVYKNILPYQRRHYADEILDPLLEAEFQPCAGKIADNPFAEDGEPNQVHTLFLHEPLDHAAFEDFARDYTGPERLAPGTREIFVDFCGGVAESKLGPAMRKLKLRATARNIRSLQRMLDKMDSN